MPSVSVIIAIYNAEDWIERCVRSLFNQTLDELEFIFVDDCSPDKSITILLEVLKEFPNRIDQVRIIRHNQNQGIAAARTTGMKAATGEYIIHCDPDDWIDHVMYEEMYNCAYENKADIVVCDYFTEGNNGQQRCGGHYSSQNPRECLMNLYKKSFFPSLWGTMIKLSLIHDYEIYPFSGINTGEDLNVVFRVFHFGNKLIHITTPFYHYYRHEGSLSVDKDTIGLFDRNIFQNITQLQSWFAGYSDYNVTIQYLKFQKKMFLLQSEKPDLGRWFNTWPECHKDIMKFKCLPIKTRLIYSLCSKSYILLWFYFKIIRKFL